MGIGAVKKGRDEDISNSKTMDFGLGGVVLIGQGER